MQNITQQPKQSNPPHQETPETARNLRLIRLYKTGNYTKSALSRMFKLSRERVGQLIKNYDNQNS
jgi:DNA-binding CsgD family transcriptional regulator